MAAFDLGSITGYATWDGTRVISGVKEFLPQGQPALRFKAFRAWAAMMVKDAKLVVYERAHMRNARTTEFMNALVANLKECAAEVNAKTLGVHSLTLKKFVSNHGHASKGDMYRAALAHGWLDEQRRDDRVLLSGIDADEIAALDIRTRFDSVNNQVDAIGCLYWGARYGGLEITLPGAPGFEAPPAVKKQKTDEERLFERIAHELDSSYGLDDFKDEE